MTRHAKTLCLLSAIAALFLIAATAVAKDVDERKWIVMESEHFTVHSSVNEKNTRDLLLHLEALRSAVAGGMDSTSILEEKPTRILVVKNSSDYDALGLPNDSVGVFNSNIRSNYIVIRDTMAMSEASVILHEYIHFLSRARDGFPYPKWWDEGIAEFGSSSELTQRLFKFGLIQQGQLSTLASTTWLPWSDVLSATSLSNFSRSQNYLFYAQSWLLVHYLFHGRDENWINKASWVRYLDKLKNGADAVAAFEHGFGISIDELTREMRRYSRLRRFKYSPIPRSSLNIGHIEAARKVSRHDIQIQLGQLALHRNNVTDARTWFDKALQIDPNNASAIAGLGVAQTLEKKFDAAKMDFARALDISPDDPLILTDFAKLELDEALAPDSGSARIDQLAKAEELLSKARSIAGDNVEIDTYLAFVWLNRDPRSEAAGQLLQKIIKRSRAELWPRLLMAEFLFRIEQSDIALALAKSVVYYDHGGNGYAAAARRLIQRYRGDADSSGVASPELSETDLPPSN